MDIHNIIKDMIAADKIDYINKMFSDEGTRCRILLGELLYAQEDADVRK